MHCLLERCMDLEITPEYAREPCDLHTVQVCRSQGMDVQHCSMLQCVYLCMSAHERSRFRQYANAMPGRLQSSKHLVPTSGLDGGAKAAGPSASSSLLTSSLLLWGEPPSPRRRAHLLEASSSLLTSPLDTGAVCCWGACGVARPVGALEAGCLLSRS